ncbi:MAG: hypothetical protein AAFV19_05015 [Pseudomonadota bacterium]
MRNSILVLIALVLVACAAPPPEKADSAPSEAQKAAALRVLEDYFEAIRSDDFAAVHGFMAPSLGGITTPATFAELHKANRARYGRVFSRTLQGASWYPGRSREGTGLAAAVDFHGRAERAPIVCGYVSLIEIETNQFAIIRDDTTFVDTANVEGMSPAERQKLLDRPGCRRFLSQ